MTETQYSTTLQYIAAVVCGGVLALYILNREFLFGVGPFWLEATDDTAQRLVGLRYFTHDIWRFPFFNTAPLGFPDGVNIIYTASIALVAAPVKILYQLTGNFFNIYGAWFLFCVMLQPVCGVFALRSIGITNTLPNIFLAVLVVCFPAWLFRYVHFGLFAQFFLLLAIGLYFRAPEYTRRKFDTVWALQLISSVLVHPYLFVICGGMFVVALVRRFAHRTGAYRECAGHLGLQSVLVLATMYVAGYLERSVNAAGFGRYSMNMISPVWPQASGILPGSQPIIDATGGQHEGFNYLGAGIIFVILVGIGASRGSWTSTVRKHPALVAFLICATLFSLSNKIYLFNLQIINIKDVPEILQQFRASGRFFWVVGYMALLSSVAIVAKRYSKPVSLCLLGFAAVLQLMDTHPLRTGMRTVFRDGHDPAAAWNVYRETPQISKDAWSPLIAEHRRLWIFPEVECSPTKYVQTRVTSLAYAASESLTPINTMYKARYSLSECRSHQDDDHEAKRSDDDLLVFLNRESWRRRLMTGGQECRTRDGIYVCSQKWGMLSDEISGPFTETKLPVRTLEGGGYVGISQGQNTEILVDGWSVPEAWGVWSTGRRSTLIFRISRKNDKMMRLDFRPFLPEEVGRQVIDVIVNGRHLTSEQFVYGELSESCCSLDLELSQEWLGGDIVRVTINVSNPTSPKRIGRSEDNRELGIALRGIKLIDRHSTEK